MRHSVAVDDAPTTPIPIGGGRTPGTRSRSRSRVVAASLAAVALLAVGAATYIVVHRSLPVPVVAVSAAGAPATPPAATRAPVAVPATPGRSATRPAGACPTASELVAEYRRHGTSPTRATATSAGRVTCAGGFAVTPITSAGDAETVDAIFAVGPPVRFREAGTGPICTDDAALLPGSTVVPRAAAAALDCVTSGRDRAPARSAGPAPVLGRSQEPGTGYGEARPSTVDDQGGLSSAIHDVRWQSWGGPRAIGSGTAWYASPAQQAAEGREERATVVAFDLGTCDGKPAYRKVQWYFPQHGGSLKPAMATDACA